MAHAQVNLEPVTWNFKYVTGAQGYAELHFAASIEPKWHLYSQYINDDGPVPTSFTFTEIDGVELLDSVMEKGNRYDLYDKVFEMQLIYFEKKVLFIQPVKMLEKKATIKGYVEFMLCDDTQCLPPRTEEFEITIE